MANRDSTSRDVKTGFILFLAKELENFSNKNQKLSFNLAFNIIYDCVYKFAISMNHATMFKIKKTRNEDMQCDLSA